MYISGQVAFDATFEVYPEVKIGDLAGAEVERVSTEVTDAAIDKTLDILRKQRRTFQQRAAADGPLRRLGDAARHHAHGHGIDRLDAQPLEPRRAQPGRRILEPAADQADRGRAVEAVLDPLVYLMGGVTLMSGLHYLSRGYFRITSSQA